MQALKAIIVLSDQINNQAQTISIQTLLITIIKTT